MGNLHDLFLLVLLGAIITSWLKLSRAREIAVAEARRHCEQHSLQLLDETVGLRAMRVRRLRGQRTLERCYGFEVSIDGGDRESGRLWMSGQRVTELVLPTSRWQLGSVASAASAAETMTPATSNVVPLRPRIDSKRLH